MDDLADRLAIRELYGDYAVAAAQQDGAAWLACWTADARWKTPHFDLNGATALGAAFQGTWSMFKSVVAFNEVGAIALDGDTATATCLVTEFMEPVGGGSLRMVGRYADALRRGDSGWKFAARGYTLISQAT